MSGRQIFYGTERELDIAVAVGSERIIVYGIIPPNADFAIKNFVDFGEFVIGNAGANDAFARIEDNNFTVEVFGKVTGVGLELVAFNHVLVKIFGRDCDKRSNVLIFCAKIFLDAIEEFCLKLAVFVMVAFSVFEVVEKNCEVTNADLIEAFELANQSVKILFAF